MVLVSLTVAQALADAQNVNLTLGGLLALLVIREVLSLVRELLRRKNGDSPQVLSILTNQTAILDRIADRQEKSHELLIRMAERRGMRSGS